MLRGQASQARRHQSAVATPQTARTPPSVHNAAVVEVDRRSTRRSAISFTAELRRSAMSAGPAEGQGGSVACGGQLSRRGSVPGISIGGGSGGLTCTRARTVRGAGFARTSAEPAPTSSCVRRRGRRPGSALALAATEPLAPVALSAPTDAAPPPMLPARRRKMIRTPPDSAAVLTVDAAGSVVASLAATRSCDHRRCRL